MPQMMLIRVVLPAPFGPRSARISPRRMVRSMRLSACRPLAYVLLTPATVTIGDDTAGSSTMMLAAAFMESFLHGALWSLVNPVFERADSLRQRKWVGRQGRGGHVCAVDRVVHIGKAQCTQCSHKRIVRVFHEEITVVFEAVEVRPSLRFINVPQAVDAAAKHQGQIRVVGLRDQQRKVTGEQQSIRGRGTEELGNPLLLRLVTGNDGAEQPAAFCEEREPWIPDPGCQGCKIVFYGDTDIGGRRVLAQLRLRQAADCGVVLGQRFAVTVHEGSGSTGEEVAGEPLRA